MIVAFDFDGILCEDEFPGIGREIEPMVDMARILDLAGHEVVLWTSRTGERLEEALEWCAERRLEFAAVNDQAPSNEAQFRDMYPEGTRKVYADVYVDDRDAWFQYARRRYGLQGAVTFLEQQIKEVCGL